MKPYSPPLARAGALATAAAVGTLLAALLLHRDALCAPRNATILLESWQGEGAGGKRAEGLQERAAGAAASAVPPSSCPTAEDVAASPWAESCHLVTKACVDLGTIVLYDDAYQPGRKGGGRKAPTFAAEENYGQYIYVYRNQHALVNYPLASIRSRGVSAKEGAEYLQRPAFSKCTVPVVWYPFWMTNFGHFLRDNGAKLHGFIQDTPWRDSIKLVPVTADGLALPGFNYQLLQPLAKLRVETWADFSTRLLPGGAANVQPGPPPSAEGDHQRCFESMFVCTHGLNITRWPLHGYGRQLVQAYREQLPADAKAAAGTASAIVEPQAAGARGRAAAKGAATVLNVVFQKRPGDTRQLLNLEDLLRRCNSWRHTTPSGRKIATKCWEAEITDLISGMAAAQLADVFVGVHGANLANGWLMRPGSSMIEIQAYGFDAHVPHLQDPLFNAEDVESRVLWWVLQGCDPAGYEPSPAEVEGKGMKSSWVKNRNIRLRWEALDTALRQVADTGGDMQRYWELWKAGQWWWHINPKNLTYGGDWHSRCAA